MVEGCAIIAHVRGYGGFGEGNVLTGLWTVKAAVASIFRVDCQPQMSVRRDWSVCELAKANEQLKADVSSWRNLRYGAAGLLMSKTCKT